MFNIFKSNKKLILDKQKNAITKQVNGSVFFKIN